MVHRGEISMTVNLLVRVDFYSSFASGQTLKGDDHGPVASETRVGWVLSGHIGRAVAKDTHPSSMGAACLFVNTMIGKSELDDELKRFWSLEVIRRKAN